MEPDEATVSAFIHEHPGGAPLDDLIPYFGCTRQRLDQIAKKAIEKCLRKLKGRRIYAVGDICDEQYGSVNWRAD